MQTLRMVEKGIRLPPPPGCPREVYKLMIECWYVIECMESCKSNIYFFHQYRHPETGHRPSFAQLVEMHSRANFELLLWKESDIQTGPQVKVVGASLEASKNLYIDLQNVYMD